MVNAIVVKLSEKRYRKDHICFIALFLYVLLFLRKVLAIYSERFNWIDVPLQITKEIYLVQIVIEVAVDRVIYEKILDGQLVLNSSVL